jgi:uracil-DNA glycosylase family 4
MNCLEAENLEEFEDNLIESGCTKCMLHNMVRTKIVVSRGSTSAKIMIIGQNPGKFEDLEGIPFIGPAGKLLDKMFAAINIDTNRQCYLTNACLCWTPDNQNPEEFPRVLETCRMYLEKMVSLLRPEIIIAVGKPAFESISKRKCGSWLGHTVGNISRSWGPRVDDRIVPVYPILHPAYLLRNEAMKQIAWEHMKKLSSIIQGMNLIPDYRRVS